MCGVISKKKHSNYMIVLAMYVVAESENKI